MSSPIHINTSPVHSGNSGRSSAQAGVHDRDRSKNGMNNSLQYQPRFQLTNSQPSVVKTSIENNEARAAENIDRCGEMGVLQEPSRYFVQAVLSALMSNTSVAYYISLRTLSVTGDAGM